MQFHLISVLLQDQSGQAVHEIVGRIEVRPLGQPYILLCGFGRWYQQATLFGWLFGVLEGEGSVGVRIDEIIVATRVNHSIINTKRGQLRERTLLSAKFESFLCRCGYLVQPANNIQYYIMFLNRGRAKSNSVSAHHRASLTAASKTRKRTMTESSNSQSRLNANQSYYMKGDQATIEREHKIFTRTAQQLSNNNFGHHQQGECLCEECQCGRHLCKLSVIRPGFTKKTVYKRSYYKQRPIRNEVNHDKEYERLKGPHLQMKSTYSQGFKLTQGDELARPHPEDLLKTHGPSQQITSYANQFPGFRGQNQYVKPTDRHAIAYFPLRGKSTYSDTYVEKPHKKDDYTYIPDQLRTGAYWFGRSTYGELYSHPGKDYFAKKVKVVEKRKDDPNDESLQYRTCYQKEFQQKQNPLCPAKVFLQTRGKGVYSASKPNFAENSDFKALSPDFHAIANSKHSHV